MQLRLHRVADLPLCCFGRWWRKRKGRPFIKDSNTKSNFAIEFRFSSIEIDKYIHDKLLSYFEEKKTFFVSVRDDAFVSKFSLTKVDSQRQKSLNIYTNLVIFLVFFFFFEKYNLILFTLEISFSVKKFLLHEVLVMQALKWKPRSRAAFGLSCSPICRNVYASVSTFCLCIHNFSPFLAALRRWC